MTLKFKFKPKKDRVRLIFTDSPERCIESNSDLNGKIIAIIGPFDSHSDKPDLQRMLTTLLRGYNIIGK